MQNHKHGIISSTRQFLLLNIFSFCDGDVRPILHWYQMLLLSQKVLTRLSEGYTQYIKLCSPHFCCLASYHWQTVPQICVLWEH